MSSLFSVQWLQNGLWMAKTEQKTRLLVSSRLIPPWTISAVAAHGGTIYAKRSLLLATSQPKSELFFGRHVRARRIMPKSRCARLHDDSLDPIPSALTSNSWHGDYPIWIVGRIKICLCARASRYFFLWRKIVCYFHVWRLCSLFSVSHCVSLPVRINNNAIGGHLGRNWCMCARDDVIDRWHGFLCVYTQWRQRDRNLWVLQTIQT